MAPKYQVTAPPGAPVPGVGFVQVNEIFTAPKDYVPSYTMLPVNEEAVAELKKVKEGLLRRAEELVKGVTPGKDGIPVDPADAKTARQYAAALRQNAASIRLEPIEVPDEAPKIEQGVPLSQLAARDAAAEPKAPTAKEDRKL